MIDDKLPEIPKGWMWTKLGEIGTINPKNIVENIEDDTEVTFLPMRCVEELTGHFDLSLSKRFSEVKKGYTPFVDNDLIFAKITPCMENGKVAIVQGLKNGLGFGSTEFHVIRLSKTIPKKFFFYFIIREELRKDAQRKMTGSAGQLRVPTTYMQQIPIPLPPLPEQHRIITKLEELFTRLDAGVSELKKTTAQLKRYRQAVLKYAFEGRLTDEWRKTNKDKIEPAQKLLERIKKVNKDYSKRKDNEQVPLDSSELPELPEGWAWSRMNEIAFITKLAGFEYTKYVKYKDAGEIPVIRAQNVKKQGFYPSNFVFVDRIIMENLPRSRLFGGEILMVFVGAGLGNVGIVPERIEYFLGPNVAKIKVEDNNIYNKYVYYFLCSEIGQNFIFNFLKATAQGSISMANIRNVVIPITSTAEQRHIVAEIERRLSIADGVEKTVGQSLVQVERLRQSILKKAFEGKLVAQDSSDEPAGKLLERIKVEKMRTGNGTKKSKQIKLSIKDVA